MRHSDMPSGRPEASALDWLSSQERGEPELRTGASDSGMAESSTGSGSRTRSSNQRGNGALSGFNPLTSLRTQTSFRSGRRKSLDGKGLTPEEVILLDAAERGDTETALAKCYSDAMLHAQDEQGRTPVMCAADANHTVTALMLVRQGGTCSELRDRLGRSSLSHAIARENVALTLTLISHICGLAGNTTHELSAHLSEREVTRMYKLLTGLDANKMGRATALIFLTDPDGALLVLVRAVTAVRDKAVKIERRDQAQYQKLREAEALIRAAIFALLQHAKELVMPARIATTQAAAEAASDLAAAQALSRQACERVEVVNCILRASQSALTVAVNNACKQMLHQARLAPMPL